MNVLDGTEVIKNPTKPMFVPRIGLQTSDKHSSRVDLSRPIVRQGRPCTDLCHFISSRI